MRHFFLFLTLIFIVTSSSAQAQEMVRVRSARHEGYSRIVFDWPANINYTAAQPSSGKLKLTFARGATLDDAAVNTLKVENLSAVKIVSKTPLTVEIDFDAAGRIRDFMAGNRVVVDLYDAPGKVVAQKPAATAPKPVVKAETPSTPATKPEPKPPVSEKKPPAKPAAENAAPAAPEPKAQAASEAPKAQQPKPQTSSVTGFEPPFIPVVKITKPEKIYDLNLITTSATTSSTMAVFLRDGKIWMINSQEDMLLSPQMSGPQIDEIMPLQPHENMYAKVFTVRQPEDTMVQAQGGGLIWRVVVSSPVENPKIPIAPLRMQTDPASVRAGTIVWPLKEIGEVIEMPDPVSGRTLTVVTVGDSKQFSGPRKEFVDFEILPSPLGITILPKVDDLIIKTGPDGVEISRPAGLSLLPDAAVKTAAAQQQIKANQPVDMNLVNARQVFDFKNWQMGGIEALDQNRNIVISELADAAPKDKIVGYVTLAKMYLANGLWAEALGFLTMAETDLPDLSDNAEFLALKGAAQALGWESEEAFETLSMDELKKFDEIGYWRAYALADLGDWQQAQTVLPENLGLLAGYPTVLRNRLSLVLSEVALRGGLVEKGEKILNMIEPTVEELNPPQKAAFEYLKGELARQKGKIDDTKKLWQALASGPDDLYRAKAGLALTRLKTEKKEIQAKQAIDNLERLRYTWRGDELEAQINYWLGKTYFETGEYFKGMNIMNEAAKLSQETNLGKRISAEMSDVFSNLFLSDQLNKISSLDAAALYEEFSGLIPPSQQGDTIVERLADHMVKADLLDRAAKLLDQQLNNRLTGIEAYRVGMRLAAIRLLDNKPALAMQALNKTMEAYETLPAELKTPERQRDMSLMRARAYAQESRTDQAITLLRGLAPHSEISRLLADIAWNSGYWDDAGEALGEVLLDENIPLTRPLSPEHSALILQTAVALNLGGDRVSLANMRQKYSDAMAQTDKARIFEVITRPRQSAALSDRETLMNIVSEVDLFGDFLKEYSSGETTAPPVDPAANPPVQEPATPPAAPATEAPATPAAAEE